MSDHVHHSHGVDLSHILVYPPQPTTIAGLGLLVLAFVVPEIALPAMISGFIAILGDDRSDIKREPSPSGNDVSSPDE